MDATSPSARFSTAALEGVLVLALVAVAILGVIRPAIGPAGLHLGTGPVFGRLPTVEVTLDASNVQITTAPPLPTVEGAVRPGDGLEFLTPTRTSVVLWSPDLTQRLGFAGAAILQGLLVMAVLGLLLAVTRTLRRGDPFVAANARRLYLIAGLVGIGGQLVVGLSAWARWQILTHPDVAPYVFAEHELSFAPLVAGLGIAVAAEVFRQGTRLRDEVEGLV
jgi:hypothetical protein